MIKKNFAFAIIGLMRGRSWNYICGEDGYYLISYDGFVLENKMYELKGKFPRNKYEIVGVSLTTMKQLSASAAKRKKP